MAACRATVPKSCPKRGGAARATDAMLRVMLADGPANVSGCASQRAVPEQSHRREGDVGAASPLSKPSLAYSVVPAARVEPSRWFLSVPRLSYPAPRLSAGRGQERIHGTPRTQGVVHIPRLRVIERSEMRNCITHAPCSHRLGGAQAVAAGLRALAATQVKHGGESARADNADIEHEQAVQEQRVKYIGGETMANPTHSRQQQVSSTTCSQSRCWRGGRVEGLD